MMVCQGTRPNLVDVGFSAGMGEGKGGGGTGRGGVPVAHLFAEFNGARVIG